MVVNVGQLAPGLLLRRLLPLTAVAVLAAPNAAMGAGPDPAPSGASLAPDPPPTSTAPVASHARTIEHAHAFLPPSIPTRPSSEATHRAAGAVKRHSPIAVSTRPRSRASSRSSSTIVRDVAPLAVDIPTGLGSVAEAVSDDSILALSALALLAASAAALSGAGLALAWSREQGLTR
jgi:hypothetical protein